MKARRALKKRGVDFEERTVDDRDDWAEEMLLISSQNTVPVFIHPDGHIEVGFEGEYG